MLNNANIMYIVAHTETRTHTHTYTTGDLAVLRLLNVEKIIISKLYTVEGRSYLNV